MPPSCRSCLTSNISDWTAAGRNEEAKRSQEPADVKLRHQNPAPSRTLKLLFFIAVPIAGCKTSQSVR